MESREQLNVYFEMEGQNYLLFRVVNIGTKDIPHFKFSGFTDLYINYKTNKNESDKGYLTEEEIEKSSFHSNIEFTYHNDGVFLSKNMNFEDNSKRYHNPYGIGVHWTPISDIHNFQPIISIAIRRMEIYHPKRKEEGKSRVYNYICKNSELFERKGKYFVLIYLKEKSKPIACFTTAQGYSDILCNVNDKLDLCILFQRHSYPDPKPYYSTNWGGRWITPYLSNSITFCNKDTSIDEMNDMMKNVFDLEFSEFLNIMGEGHIVNLTEDKLKIIDIVDRVYSPINGTNMVKPLFIKLLLKSIPNYQIFNARPEKERVDFIIKCYLTLKERFDKKQ